MKQPGNYSRPGIRQSSAQETNDTTGHRVPWFAPKAQYTFPLLRGAGMPDTASRRQALRTARQHP